MIYTTDTVATVSKYETQCPGISKCICFLALAHYKIYHPEEKRELANSVDDNELLDFTDVFALRWNIMTALKHPFAIAVICIPFPAMFTLSKLECFSAHHIPVLMFLSTSVENQYLGSFRQLNHL